MTNYIAKYDATFKDLLRTTLRLGRLKENYINLLLDKGLDTYIQAFTHSSVNEAENYEFLEMLGDVTANKVIVWYFSRRFPQLNCPKGVKIVARLRINFVSKEKFSYFAKILGFLPFISSSYEERDDELKSLLEDVFEAFIGATEKLIDEYIKKGTGYDICYNIISYLLDKEDISLKYEDLYDAKTRLKEFVDFNKDKIGVLRYKYFYTGNTVTRVEIYTELNKELTFLSSAIAASQSIAEQTAAASGLKVLEKQGYTKRIPEEYRLLCSNV